MDSLIHIMHTLRNSLAVSPKLRNGENHLLQTDIPIIIAVQRRKTRLGISLVLGPKHLVQVIHVQGIAASQHKRHPQAASQGLGRGALLQCQSDDGVRGGRVKDLFAGDLVCDLAKGSGDLVTHTTNILNQTHGRCGTSTLVVLARPALLVAAAAAKSTDDVVDDIILVLELLAVLGEHAAGGVVEQADEVDVALGVLDAQVELLAVVGDGDELDEDLFGGEEEGGDEGGEEDVLDDILPFLDAGVAATEIVGVPCHDLFSLSFHWPLRILSFGGGDSYWYKSGQGGDGPADKRKRNLQLLENQGILASARTHNTAEELKQKRHVVCNDLGHPQTQPDHLDPGEEPDDLDAPNAGIGRRRGTDDDGDGDEGGQGQDVDEVARDDGEVEDLGVELAHAGEGAVLGGLSLAAHGVGQGAAAAVEEGVLFMMGGRGLGGFGLVCVLRGRVAVDGGEGDVDGGIVRVGHGGAVGVGELGEAVVREALLVDAGAAGHRERY